MTKRERLIRSAHVPVVRPRRIVGRVGPRYKKQRWSYYETRVGQPDFGTVYLAALEDLPHELGHVFDRNLLTLEDRAAVTRLLKVKVIRPWFWGEHDPEKWAGLEPLEEVFANAYADCFLHPNRRKGLRRWLRDVYGRATASAGPAL